MKKHKITIWQKHDAERGDDTVMASGEVQASRLDEDGDEAQIHLDCGTFEVSMGAGLAQALSIFFPAS